MNSKYKWYILLLIMLTAGTTGGLLRFCMPVLFKEISLDLNLGLVKIGTVWGMDPLAGIFVGLPGGLLADRFGVKRTMVVVCLLAAVVSALRGLSFNFLTLAGSMFLFGLVVAITPAIVPKAIALWAGDRGLALANALLSVFWSIGGMIGTMTSASFFSPLLGGWRNVLFFYSAPAFIFAMLWLITGREPRKNELSVPVMQKVSFKQALSRVLRVRDVWVLGLILTALWGANNGFVGYLSLYLKNSGWNTASADGITTILIASGLAGAIPMTLLANRMGSRKGMLIFSIAMSTVGIALVPFVQGIGVYLVIFIFGFLRSAGSVLLNTMVFEIPEVGSTYGGTALGLASSMSMIGAFVTPPIGNALEPAGSALPFVFWALVCALGIPACFFLKKQTRVLALENI